MAGSVGMCGRLNTSLDPADLADELGASLVPHAFSERYNVPPGSTIPILVDRPDAGGVIERRLEPARWGLVPGWAKDLRAGFRAFNARAETAAVKPTFRAAFGARRCVVPVRGYYEWEVRATGSTGGGTADAPGRGSTPEKTPWLMESAAHPLLLMAGLFEFRRLSAEEQEAAGADPAAASGWLVSATVLTTEARGHLREVHDRMPVMLTRTQMDEWLAPERGSAEGGALLSAVIAGFDPAAVVRRTVSPAVGNVRNDGPELVEPQG
ncbi:SOS response-associated peptidase [Brevibacterium salitolerans]|uniref:Abasic site processing protein n=1 Tax=Brevibacterium salitolerans TaxID=1403566 RepID=A0ABN2WY13_9MICO